MSAPYIDALFKRIISQFRQHLVYYEARPPLLLSHIDVEIFFLNAAKEKWQDVIVMIVYGSASNQLVLPGSKVGISDAFDSSAV